MISKDKSAFTNKLFTPGGKNNSIFVKEVMFVKVTMTLTQK